jgi:hypothetical protein
MLEMRSKYENKILDMERGYDHKIKGNVVALPCPSSGQEMPRIVNEKQFCCHVLD